MNAIIKSVVELIPFFIWIVITCLGGIWLVKAAFKLTRYEEVLAGSAVGIVLETWIFNLTGRIVDINWAIWISAGLVVMAGFVALFLSNGRTLSNHLDIKIPPLQLLAFLFLTFVFFRMASGMAIYDDFKALPMTTMIAIGKIPPVFPFNPAIKLDEHYFYYLLAGQIMRVGTIFPWRALNMVRSLMITMLLFHVGYLTMRITRSLFSGILAGAFALLSGGARWLLLLLPNSVVTAIGNAITLSGSGKDSGATLGEALINPWAAQGMGPVAFPFTFVSGFNQAMILALSHDTISPLIALSLLLAAKRWRNNFAILISTLLFAAMGLVNEILFMYMAAGIGLWIFISWIRDRKIRFTSQRGSWLLIVLGSFAIALFQGGVLNSLLTQFMQKVLLAGSSQMQPTYHNFTFSFVFPPTASTSHFGRLSLFNPFQLTLLFVEAGPIVFLLPSALVYLKKAFCADRWLDAGFFSTILFSAVMFFVLVTGTRVDTAFNRAQSAFILPLKIFGLAFIWMMVPKMKDFQRGVLAAGIGSAVLSGVVIFAIQLVGMQKPVMSLFIDTLDAKVMSDYWGKLDENFMVFDPNVPRGVTVFGKANTSSIDFYARTPEWQALTANPDPFTAMSLGYGYMYYDDKYVRSLELSARELLNNSCMELMEELSDWRWGKRWLYDIRACVKP